MKSYYQSPKVFTTVLKVHTKRANGESIAFHKWEGYTLQQLVKWSWYFKYRAALYQVKYPRAYIQVTSFKVNAVGRDLTRALYNRWVAKKRKITEWTNKIKRAEDNYSQLFPIEEQKGYITAVAKLARLKEEFKEMNIEYNKSLIT